MKNELLHQIDQGSLVRLPLLVRINRELKDIQPLRQEVSNAVESGNQQKFEQMGFPADLLRIMQEWHTKGPSILTSFSHPEEMDIYKTLGILTLFQIQHVAQEQHIELPRILIMYYDTVTIHKSASKPLSAGGIGINSDIFGVANLRGNSTTEILLTDVATSQERFIRELPDDAIKIVASLNEELMQELRQSTHAQHLGISKKMLVSESVNIVEKRLQMISAAFNKSVPVNSRMRGKNISASNLLMRVEQQLIADALHVHSQSLEQALGYESSLFSQDKTYLALIRKTTEQLIDLRGMQLFKTIIDPGEGLAISDGNDSKKMLSIDMNNNFVLKDRNGNQEIISDEDARTFVLTQIPLGKLETIAMVAGGYTLHMGSEHGARPRIVTALGLTKRAAQYASKLRIGEDKEQAVEGLVIKGTSTYIPLPMAIMLLGTEGVNDILKHALITRTPIEVDIKELKKLVAKRLLDEILETVQK